MKTRQSAASLAAAALLATLALAACQNAETTAPDSPSEALESIPDLEALETRMVPEGRPATAAEIAEFLAAKDGVPAVNLADAETPLAKTAAALPTCIVNFNSSTSLDAVASDGYTGTANGPYYDHICNNSFAVQARPVNANMYRLTPEAANWCTGTPFNIGTRVGGVCANQTRAIYWPRMAGTMGGASGVRFMVWSAGLIKNFDLRAVTIRSSTARIVALRAVGGYQTWTNLTPGRWTWPVGTTLRDAVVFHQTNSAIVLFDNLEIAIHP